MGGYGGSQPGNGGYGVGRSGNGYDPDGRQSMRNGQYPGGRRPVRNGGEAYGRQPMGNGGEAYGVRPMGNGGDAYDRQPMGNEDGAYDRQPMRNGGGAYDRQPMRNGGGAYDRQPMRNGGEAYDRRPVRNDGGRSGKNGRKKRGKRTFGDVIRLLLMLVALAVFCYSGYMLYTFYREYKKGSDEYDNLEANYSVSQDESENMNVLEDDKVLEQLQGAEDEAQSVQGRVMVTVTENGKQVSLPVMNNPIDFTELKQINQDICGWLRIRAIDISYPLVQGEDNDYYLHRTFEGESNFAGCLFLNYTNKTDFTDQNTIIYGHNMKNGSMFGKLKQFGIDETFQKSKYFWIFTPDFIYQYRIFSAMVVNKVGLTYQTMFLEDEFRNFVEIAFSNSQVDNTGVEVTDDDRVVTLSTCTGDDETRFVVMGKLAQVYVPKDQVGE